MSSGTPKQTKPTHGRVPTASKSEKLKLLTAELKSSKSTGVNNTNFHDPKQRVRVSTKFPHDITLSSKKDISKPTTSTLDSIYGGTKKSSIPLSPREASRGRPGTALQDLTYLNTESGRRETGGAANYRVGHLRSGFRHPTDGAYKRAQSMTGSQKYTNQPTWHSKVAAQFQEPETIESNGLKKQVAYMEPTLVGYSRQVEYQQDTVPLRDQPRPLSGVFDGSGAIPAKGKTLTLTQSWAQVVPQTLSPAQVSEIRELREKERQILAGEFCNEYRGVLTSVSHLDFGSGFQTKTRPSAEAILTRSPFRSQLEKLTTLEFKTNEFVPIHVSEKYNKSLPIVIIQIDGVFGCSYTNLSLGTELVLTKRYTCSEFTQRQACIVDQNLANSIKALSEFVNVVLVFQKSHSKAKELAIFLGQTLKNEIVGIFTRKLMNKSSKFVSYTKILSHYSEVIPKQVYIIAPLKGDIKYWTTPSYHPREKQDGIKQCRYLGVNDVQETFDIILPLINPTSKFQFRIGLVEDFACREAELIKKCTNEPMDDGSLFFEVGPTNKSLYDKIEAFVRNKPVASPVALVPHRFKEYFEFFHLVTHRNYLKYMRTKEKEMAPAKLEPPQAPG